MTIRELITKFSSAAPAIAEYTETLRVLKCACTIGEIEVSAEIDAEPDLGLNARDHISIHLDGDDGLLASYMPAQGNSWQDFIRTVKDNDAEENVRLVVNVSKNLNQGRLSLYDIAAFSSHLENKGFEAILHEFDQEIGQNGKLCVEVQNTNYTPWNTQQIAFVNLNSETPGLSAESLERVRDKQEKICSANFQVSHITPNTFLVSAGKRDNERIQNVFEKCAQVMCLYYLYDQLSVSGQGITYKMVGLKTLSGTIEGSTIGATQLNSQSAALYVGVFNWLYDGGNIYDKAIIARNVLSLNIDERTLALGKQTLDAVISNFNIYEKENVKQYIEVKNKVTDTVGKMQKEIISAIDDYTGGFLKIMTANLTFFLTVIIIRVLAKNIEEGVILPNAILYLSYALWLVSLFYLLYCRKDAGKRKNLKEEHFKLLKDRYKEILGDLELETLSSDFDEKKENTTAHYIKMRMTQVTWLWSACLAIIFMAITMILICNLNTPIKDAKTTCHTGVERMEEREDGFSL